MNEAVIQDLPVPDFVNPLHYQADDLAVGVLLLHFFVLMRPVP